MDDKQYTEMAVKLQEVDSRCRSNEHRLDELDGEMDKIQEAQITLVKLANGVDKMADQLVDMKADIKDVKTSQKELSDKVTTLENKPAVETKRKWDSISGNLWWLFIGGVAAFLLGQALPGIF